MMDLRLIGTMADVLVTGTVMPLDPRAQRLLSMMAAAAPNGRERPSARQRRLSLENIKSLSGSTPEALAAIDASAAVIVKAAAAVQPPDELRTAHAQVVSAAQLAANAARIRRQATLAGDMAGAWDASSAAAGALMLGSSARREIVRQLNPPRLP